MSTARRKKTLIILMVALSVLFVQMLQAQPGQDLEAFSHCGGWPGGSVVKGDYAYLIQAVTLTVLDITGADFHRVAALTLPAEPSDIVIQDNFAYLVISSSDSALLIVDISDPLKPKFVKRVALKTNWPARSFIADHHLYVVSNNTLQIVDVTNPAEPAISGSKAVPGNDIFVRGEFAFIGGSDGLHILDISDPTKPKQVSFLQTQSVNGVCVQDDYAYLLGYRNTAPKVELSIVNIASVNNPVIIGTTTADINGWLSTTMPGRITVVDGNAYCGVSNNLFIFNVTTPSAPAQSGVLEYTEGMGPGFQSLQVIPPFAFAAMGTTDFGFAKFDISDAANPNIAWVLKEPWDVTHFCAAHTMVYVASQERILIYDYADPEYPVLVGQNSAWPEQYRICVDGTMLYGIDNTQLHIVDISDPANMTEKGSYTLPAGKKPRAITVRGCMAYLMTVAMDLLESQLDILDVSDPANILLKGTYTFSGEARDLFVPDPDTLAFIAFDEGVGSGLHLVDIHDPVSPVLIGSAQVRARPTCVWVSDTLAYVGSNDGNTTEANWFIEVFNAVDPASPQLASRKSGTGLVADLEVYNNKVYASIQGGSIYQFAQSIIDDKIGLNLIAQCHSPASIFIAMIIIRNMLYAFTCDGAWSVEQLMVSASQGLFIQYAFIAMSPVEMAADLEAPAHFALQQNYPNPFNPETAIAFDVNEKSRVVIKVFDTLGHEVASLVDGDFLPGRYITDFHAKNLPSGIYFYRMQIKNSCIVKQMILMK